MNHENDTIIISDEEAGERLDKILGKRFEGRQSRTYFQYLIEQNLVLLNGEPIKKRAKPAAGDEVEIQFVLTPEINLTAEDIPLNILFEDDDILVINKPYGMVVHPAPGNWTGTFVNALMFHCQKISSICEGSLRPGIVHRLDKETSGVLVAAKTNLAHQKLTQIFASRQVHKEYLVVCLGNPGDVEISAPIGRHPVHRKQMAIVETGKSALSICKLLATDGKLSIVKVLLVTGRTHQIRVHMKHKGTPVLGDATYGNTQYNKKHGVNRQMLHAEKLVFNHPITGIRLEFQAPVPEDMKAVMKSIAPKLSF